MKKRKKTFFCVFSGKHLETVECEEEEDKIVKDSKSFESFLMVS
jgi:hypothetical protein